MSTDPNALGTAINTAVEALSITDKRDGEKAWQTIAGPIATAIDAGGGGGGGGAISTAAPLTGDGTSGTPVTIGPQAAHAVLAGPTSGSSATPTFRALVAGDIPALSYDAAGAAASAQAAAIAAAATDATTKANAAAAASLPLHGTADSAASLTTTLPISGGGTGATTAGAARTALGLGTAATHDVGDFAALTSSLPADVSKTTAAVGTATTAARADHQHSISTGAPSTLAAGGSNTEGSSSSLARADHVHALPAYGTGSGTICQGNDTRLPPAPSAAGKTIYDTGSAYAALAAGSVGQGLRANGAAAPSWSLVDALLWGDGADGAYTFDGTNTYSNATKSGSGAGAVYTLTGDINATNVTITNSCVVKTNGWAVRGTGTLQIDSGASLNNNGGDASAGTAGTAPSNNFLGGGAAGGAGVGTNAGGNSGNSTNNSIGGNGGGRGGQVGANTGGTAGSANQAGASKGANIHSWPACTGWAVSAAGGGIAFTGGAGGGSGASDGTGTSGAGGAGGGVLVIAFPTIVNNGTISANGGAGGTPSSGTNVGGGCGGGGGAVLYNYAAGGFSGNTPTATAGGIGSGRGTAGAANNNAVAGLVRGFAW